MEILKVEHLVKQYGKGDNAVLAVNDISFSVEQGEFVAIVGSSGSGKSTLLKIMYKYYEVERDKLYIGKYDINDYTLKDIRNNITYISQNELLYTDTIKNNIILDRQISYEDFLEVCNLTYVSDIIKEKKISYDYLLEESGANLSGGQRQRIVLARALLKQSKIILIDEGLNEVDISLERKILLNIFKKYQDKTIIIISHRLDNSDLYNLSITLNEGTVKEVVSKKWMIF